MPQSPSTRRVARRAGCVLRLSVLVAAILLTSAGCGSGPSGRGEVAYVSAQDASLRDHVSAVYNKTGLVHNGERLLVLERMQNRRFVRVRSPRGEEGWIQERYLADQRTFDQAQQLAEQYKSAPAQATATVELQVRLHVLPGRKTESLYMLNEKQKVDLLERRGVPRNATPAPAEKPKDADDKDDEKDDGDAQVPMEDWWLVRDADKRVGWVLGGSRILYVDLPLEIAQYSEGQRIVAAFQLDEVPDGDKKVVEYLTLFTENKDGLPFDFNQIRVYTWNSRKHRYETAYREKNLDGSLPATLGQQDFGGKEGTLRTFTLHLKDDDGKERQQVYKFNPPIVRKVYAPGEEPPARPKSKKKHASTTKVRSSP